MAVACSFSKPYLPAGSQFSDPSPWLSEALNPIVEAVGATVLGRFTAYRMHKQVRSRLDLLHEIGERRFRSSVGKYLFSDPAADGLAHRLSKCVNLDPWFDDFADPFLKRFQRVEHRLRHDALDGVSVVPVYGESKNRKDWRYGDPVAFSGDDESLVSADEYLKFEAELGYVRGVYARLDNSNTIDQTPTDYKKWRDYFADNPAKLVRERYGCPKFPARKDEASLKLEKATIGARRSALIARVTTAMTQAHNAGWYMSFDTLTLSNDGVSRFYAAPNALRDYFRDCGRAVLAGEGRKKGESFSDCYQYFCVPEYGAKTGRLHWHVVHLMRTLPPGTYDVNRGKPTKLRYFREIPALKKLWEFGNSSPISVRYQGDRFTRDGWLWPVNSPKRKNPGRPIESKPYQALIYYVCKYVNKRQNAEHCLKYGGDKWAQAMRRLINGDPVKFRVRMSRNFGTKIPSMAELSTDCLIELTQIHHTVSPVTRILKRNAKFELSERLRGIGIVDIQRALPQTKDLLASLRTSMKMNADHKLLSFIDTVPLSLTNTDISNETRRYVWSAGLAAEQMAGSPRRPHCAK